MKRGRSLAQSQSEDLADRYRGAVDSNMERHLVGAKIGQDIGAD